MELSQELQRQCSSNNVLRKKDITEKQLPAWFSIILQHD